MKYAIIPAFLAVCMMTRFAAGIVWTGHAVVDYYNGPSSLMTVDIDDDGDMDVLGGATYGDDVMWWESDLTGITEHGLEIPFNGECMATIVAGSIILPDEKECVVVDIAGRIVDHDDLSPGIYFICHEHTVMQKVVKVR